MASAPNIQDQFMANGACLRLIVKLLNIRFQLLEGNPVTETSIQQELAMLEFYAGLSIVPDSEFVRAVYDFFEGSDDELDFHELCQQYLGQALPTGDPDADKQRELLAILKRFGPSGKPQ